MLRECGRVLKPGGKVGVFTIETAYGLSPAEEERAAALGPSSVRAEGPLPEIVERAGLRVRHSEDVTPDFDRVARKYLDQLRRYEREMRAAEGDELFEVELKKKSDLVLAIESGLVVRTFVVAERVLS